MVEQGRVFQVRFNKEIGCWQVMLRDEWEDLPLGERADLEDVADHIVMFRRPPFTVKRVGSGD